MKSKIIAVLLLTVLTASTCTVSAAIINQNKTFTTGAAMVERNGLLAAPGGKQLTIFDQGGNICKELSFDDFVSYWSVFTDDNYFFGAAASLYQMDLSDYSVKELAHDMYSPQPFGLIGDELYFTYTTDLEAFEDNCLMSVNLENGQLTEYGMLPAMCGHSSFEVLGDKIVYNQGVADVGTYALYFFDPVSRQVEEITPCCGGYYIAQDILYYTRTEKPDDRTQCKYELVKYESASGKEEILIGGANKLQGIGIDAVDDDYVYLRSYGQDGCCIYSYSLESGEVRNLISGPAISFVNVIDHTIYWAYCDYDAGTYTLNSYTLGTGEIQEDIMVTENYFSYVTDEVVFMNAWVGDGEVYTAVPRNQ